MILVEWMHWARIIRLDSEHPAAEIRSFGGDSIGRWEGDTLVVGTTNFLDWPSVAREGLRVVERFTPVDRDTLLYELTVHDPDYVAPYSGELVWPKTEARSYEYACHEGNYAMGNMLRGARLLEQEWMEKRDAPESDQQEPSSSILRPCRSSATLRYSASRSASGLSSSTEMRCTRRMTSPV